ncbi:MAG: hypothetical protein U0892_17215 [Pirellulales bacterium]
MTEFRRVHIESRLTEPLFCRNIVATLLAIVLSLTLMQTCDAQDTQDNNQDDSRPATSQNSTSQTETPAYDPPAPPPTPLIRERTEDQVEEFLRQAPPSTDRGKAPGLQIFTETSFDTGALLAAAIACFGCLCLMIPGSVLFISGMSGHALPSVFLGRLISVLCLLSFLWLGVLYSYSFSRNAHTRDVLGSEIHSGDPSSAPGSRFVGDERFFAMHGILPSWTADKLHYPLHRRYDRIPHLAFAIVQMCIYLSAIAPLVVIVSASSNRLGVILFSVVWSCLVYVPACYWTAGGGWLADCIDMGSGIQLHVVVGFSVLGISMVLRPRESSQKMNPDRLAIGVLLYGAGLLMSSSLGLIDNNPVRGIAWLNIFIGGATGTLIWSILPNKHPDEEALWPIGLLSGCAVVLAGAAAMFPVAAVMAAVCGTVLTRGLLRAGAFGIHDCRGQLLSAFGCAGGLGLLMTGVMAVVDVAGADSTGHPISGLLGGDLEQIRVQF